MVSGLLQSRGTTQIGIRETCLSCELPLSVEPRRLWNSEKTAVREDHGPLLQGYTCCRGPPQNCWRNKFSPLSVWKEIQRFEENQLNENKKGQNEQAQQLIGECKLHRKQKGKFFSVCVETLGVGGSRSTNHNKRPPWKSRQGKSLKFKMFIITESKYSI